MNRRRGCGPAGGRTGITAIVTGLLFLCSLVAAPFVSMVPTAATAPALIVVGSLMLHTLGEIEWKQPLIAFPAFLTLVLIPLTTSIANGLGFGIIAYAALHLAMGKFNCLGDWLLYTLSVLFLGALHLRGGNVTTGIRDQGLELPHKRRVSRRELPGLESSA